MESSVEDERVMPILLEALQLQPEERMAYLRAACDGDLELEAELVEALQWEERMGSFLLKPLFDLTQIARPFEPGQIISDRFEIIREVGEGGMGIVYEAFDRRRNKRIAIKAAKPGFQRLLSPELEGALQVRHHNTCLLNEIHTSQTELGDIDFLTMEFLDGQTLAARLVEQGKLNHAEALTIACQLCAGLAEAHHSGIIHRDLKSGNVILCKNDDGSLRAVITDFGLAGGPDLSSGVMGGTPGYMAPELNRGERASKASDIYALGVILYEMVAGRKPYTKQERQKEELATGLLQATTWDDDRPSQAGGDEWRPQSTWVFDAQPHKESMLLPPPPPSTWTKGLDPRWDRVTMGCLELSPEERTQDVNEVLAALQKEPIRKAPFVAAALLLITLSAVVGLVPPLRRWVIESIWPPDIRLAVLPLEKQSDPALAAIGGGALQAVADRVQQLPSGRRSVAVIPPSQAASMHVETPKQARDVLHATHALKVGVHREGEQLSIEAAVIDLNSQLPIKELSFPYSQTSIATMPTALTGLLAMALQLREGPVEAKLLPAATAPYLQGLYLLNRDAHSFEEATARFQEAAGLDPNSVLPLAGMVLAQVQKCDATKDRAYCEQAREFLRAAQSRDPDSVMVLLASGRLNEGDGQNLKALQDYRRIQDLEPRNVEALLRTAVVYENLKMPEEAVAALRKARDLDPEYYKPYQRMGVFYYDQGQYAESAEQFRNATERAPGMFDAYTDLASILVSLGRDAEAEEAVQTSLKIRETAKALNCMGAIRAYQGRYAEAVAYQKRALMYDPANYIWLLNVADNSRWAGHPADARPFYRKARDLAKAEITANPQSGRARAYFAYFCARLGNRTRAEEEISQAMSLEPDDNDVRERAILTYEALGERDRAIDLLKGIAPAEMEQLARHPDLADFSRDPRFKKQMIDKGGH
jgi:eukaryotic-like serine/threonine-protein kinase